LSQQEIKLFEGNRDALDSVALDPTVLSAGREALDTDLKERHVQTWTHGSESTAAGVHHGTGSKADAADNITERFFRAVDRSILDKHSRPSGLPLVLAALPENLALFHRLSHNPFLVAKGIEGDPGPLTIEALRDRAWGLFEPHYQARLAALIDMFGAARSKNLGTGDVAQAARNAVAGRVATLLIDADKHVPGRIDPLTGAIEFDDLANPEVEDMLDDLGELVLKHGGQVVIVPTSRMPTESGVAAIDRF
jgi:hypothetical protein